MILLGLEYCCRNNIDPNSLFIAEAKDNKIQV